MCSRATQRQPQFTAPDRCTCQGDCGATPAVIGEVCSFGLQLQTLFMAEALRFSSSSDAGPEALTSDLPLLHRKSLFRSVKWWADQTSGGTPRLTLTSGWMDGWMDEWMDVIGRKEPTSVAES